MRKALVLTLGSMLAIALAQPAGAGTAEQKVFPPDAVVRGMTLEGWGSVFSVWLQEIPAPVNPVFDPFSPRNCDVQPGGVVFVAGPGADCAIPEGSIVVFGTFGWECSTAEGLGETYGELRNCARENFARELNRDAIHQRLLIDGDPLKFLRQWVIVTPGEVVDFPRDNIWGVEPGPSKSVTKGWLFILRPLDEGKHRIVNRVTSDVFGDQRFVWKLRVVDD